MTVTPTAWAAIIEAQRGHLLQSWAWGELKSRFGWAAERIQVGEAAVQLLLRQLPLGFSIAYVPKGPLVDWADSAQCETLLTAIHTAARKKRAVFLKIEPDVSTAGPLAPTVNRFLTERGFNPAETIQPRTSQVLDLSASEAHLLQAMKQKTRYNIRLAQKKGVTIRSGDEADLTAFYDLSLLTAQRDGFGIHDLAYYQLAYRLFAPDRCALLLAEFEGRPLAALMVFRQGAKAYYFYGASSNEERNRMPTYLLQWATIEWGQQQGCTAYDLWGIPDANPATLEAEFQARSDGLWGVYRFKRGFGGEVVRSVGAFDFVYNPMLYRLYRLRRGV